MLQRVRTVEQCAATPEQRRRAAAGSAVLFAAARLAGWESTEIAKVVGLTPSGVRLRTGAVPTEAAAGLAVPPRPPRRAPKLDPAEWLTARRAVAYTGIAPRTLGLWRDAGLLPNTIRVSRSTMRYLRADLDLIMAAPKYHNRGVDYAAVRRAITG